VRGRAPSPRGLPFAFVLAALASAALPAAGGADSPGELRQRATELRNENVSLATRSSSALHDLYALETQLAHARVRLANARTRAAAIRKERVLARQRLSIARRALALSERNLAQQLRALYEQGDADRLGIVLGAGSLDDALTALEGLHHAAAQTRAVIAQASRARRALIKLSRALTARVAALERAQAAAAAEAAALERTRSERAAYLSRLVSSRRVNSRAIASLVEQARAAEARSRVVVRVAAPSNPEAQLVEAGPPTAGRTLTVVATGYSLRGRTASGLPVGWGAVAVDPAVIPLGTRLTIPGYGSGIAADTGSSVRGARIDLWFPTRAQALAWGARTVTITVG
jgi:3D (Asp-Asp-Asp) domain-containing protein/septal ring factor EnvC (AmiA/AmiB activator)